MTIDFWAERWKEGRIGFHEGRPNVFLARHVGRLGPPPKRVLVPLCGKTVDMAFLAAQGHEVIGIEAVEDAVRAFFREHKLEPTVRERTEHIREYSAGRVTVLSGDVFACTKEIVGPADALYDRAALVALPDDVRPRYAAHVRSLLEPGSVGLVITFEYEQAKMAGPPYAVNEAEVRQRYAGARIAVVDSAPLDSPRFRETGVAATELCFTVEL